MSDRASGLVALVLATAVMASCTDETIVFRDRPPFNAPPDSVNGFLGYYDASARQTTCGNCHASYQASWKQTKHANAFIAVDTSAAKATTCYNCHTVSGNGNKTSGTNAAYALKKDSVYHDVQCESCHGPGLQHVEGVGQGTVVRPLARLSMSGAGNCGDCHSGTHQPFAEEWAQSGHANLDPNRASRVSSGCDGCHDGRSVLKRWGVEANYVERDSATGYQATTCAVCHNPHGGPNPAQLRFPVSSPDPELNLCMKCHLRRVEPSFTQSSPHAPQGAVLLGLAGYRPPGFAYDTARIYGSHATTLNPKLCAGCHVTRFSVTDAATGAFSFQATGHLMRPVPCLDSAGKPTADKTCGYTATSRSWKSCTQSGCHADSVVAANAFNTVRNRMKFYTNQLWVDLNGSGSMQAFPTDSGLLPRLRQMSPAQWSSSDSVVTAAEGAEFNARLCGEYGQSTADNSKGIHNPFLCEALLQATVNYIKSFYSLSIGASSVTASPGPPLTSVFAGSMHISRTPPGREPR